MFGWVLAPGHDFWVADEAFDFVGSVVGEAVEDGVGHELIVEFLDNIWLTE